MMNDLLRAEILEGEYNYYYLELYRELASTNAYARSISGKKTSNRTVICAESQTKGRGKGKRKWFSPSGGVYMSLILHCEKYSHNIMQLSFVFSLAVGFAIKDFYGLNACYKWPNDILLEGKKFAGILMERYSHSNCQILIIGLGLNICNYPSDTEFPSTSLMQVISCNDLVPAFDLIQKILWHFDILEHEWCMFGFAKIKNLWIENAFLFRNKININIGDALYEGVFCDLKENGGLVLERCDGSKEIISYGEMLQIDDTR